MKGKLAVRAKRPGRRAVSRFPRFFVYFFIDGKSRSLSGLRTNVLRGKELFSIIKSMFSVSNIYDSAKYYSILHLEHK